MRDDNLHTSIIQEYGVYTYQTGQFVKVEVTAKMKNSNRNVMLYEWIKNADQNSLDIGLPDNSRIELADYYSWYKNEDHLPGLDSANWVRLPVTVLMSAITLLSSLECKFDTNGNILYGRSAYDQHKRKWTKNDHPEYIIQ